MDCCRTVPGATHCPLHLGHTFDMSSNSTGSYAPDEPPAVLWLEQAIMAGVGMGDIAYGTFLTRRFSM